jgi:hypothetical protein
MKDDREIFLTLNKERDKSVSFGNDNSARIIGRGIVNLGSKDAKVENVLLVEDMNQNILRFIQMCDQGHELLFDSEKCEIRKEGLGKMVAIARRTPNNIYVLNEFRRGKCCLGKENEVGSRT